MCATVDASVGYQPAYSTTGMLEVEVPRGCSGGDEVDFVSPAGTRMTVEVPAGLSPGDKFLTAIPSQLTVVVPEGVHAGEEISVEHGSDGEAFVVKVPEGVHAGMEFMVDPPSARPEEPTGSFSLRRSSSPSADATPSTVTAMASSDDSPGSASADTAKAIRLHAADELRVPSPEPGREFYIGQHVLMPRKGGGASNGVVLEVIDGFETLYRLRIGDGREGSLEKHCAEDEIRPSTPQPGFEFFVGQMVRVTRRDGRPALATVLAPTFVRDGDDDEGEAVRHICHAMSTCIKHAPSACGTCASPHRSCMLTRLNHLLVSGVRSTHRSRSS